MPLGDSDHPLVRLPRPVDECIKAALEASEESSSGWARADPERAQPFYLTPITWEPSGDYSSGGLVYSFPNRSNADDLININMMPFIAEDTLEDCKLPEYVEPYWSLIQACLNPEMERATWSPWPTDKIPLERGRVNYLTIQEGWVEAGESQRRPGLHVDSPGEVKIKNEAFEKLIEGQGDSQAYGGHHWGLGCCHFIPHLPHTAGRTNQEKDGEDNGTEKEEEDESQSCSDCMNERVHVCQADKSKSEQSHNDNQTDTQMPECRSETPDSLLKAKESSTGFISKLMCSCCCHNKVGHKPEEEEDNLGEKTGEVFIINEEENEYEEADEEDHDDESNDSQNREDAFVKIMSSNYVLQGGIYLGSSLANSCRAWDCQVDTKAVGR